MKIPTPGQIVLFHFHDRERKALVTRPAVVVIPPDDNSGRLFCGLYVMWWPDDKPKQPQMLILSGYAASSMHVPTTVAPMASDGAPADNTWTHRPEDL